MKREADKKLARAANAVHEATKELGELLTSRVAGAEEWSKEFKSELAAEFAKLLQMKHSFFEQWEDEFVDREEW